MNPHCAKCCGVSGVSTINYKTYSVDFNKVPIKERAFHTPPLEEIVEVLTLALPASFASVEVSVAVPPDLTEPPYNLAAPGLCGDPKLIDLGGHMYLAPKPNREKLYDMAELARHLHREQALLIGAGIGVWPHFGTNCEDMLNLKVNGLEVKQCSHVVSVEPVGAPKGEDGYIIRPLPETETRTALFGNYLMCDGEPGEVLKVVVKKRIGEKNFINAIRFALKEHYGEENVIGMGGTFLLVKGKANMHVMPDFSPTPLVSEEDFEDWLHVFEMTAPMTYVGTFVTGDLNMGLRVQHFHGWSEHGDGGHYRHDTTPDEVHYEGYFALATHVVRVDRPKKE